MTQPPYSEATLTRVAKAFHDTVCDIDCSDLSAFTAQAHRLLADMSEAGLLLPEGAKRETEYGLSRADRDTIAAYRDREHAELWQGWSEPGWVLVSREAITTTWTPADAVRLAEEER